MSVNQYLNKDPNRIEIEAVARYLCSSVLADWINLFLCLRGSKALSFQGKLQTDLLCYSHLSLAPPLRFFANSSFPRSFTLTRMGKDGNRGRRQV